MADIHQSYSDIFSGSLTPASSIYKVGPKLITAANIAKCSNTTQTLVDKAERALASFERDQDRLLPHTSNLSTSMAYHHIDPHTLLRVMLENAPNERGQRYVASAIGECDGDTSTLVDLSNTWIRYLLVPFKGNCSVADFPPSEAATGETSHDLDPSMTNLVRIREGDRCPFTEFYHKGCAPPGAKVLPLEVAHIIKRAVGVFDATKDHGSLITWDILRNYVGWDAERTQEILENLDTPLNGMLLERNLHHEWDNYAWSLKPALDDDGRLVPDAYEVEEMGPDQFLFLHKPDHSLANRRITFNDHGADPTIKDYMPKSDIKLIAQTRLVPDPELISLHRALCRVLHMSGAAEVIDSIFRDVGNEGPQVPSAKIRTTDELDLIISSFGLSSVSI